MSNTLTAEQRLQCLRGTFEVENMQISTETQAALQRLSDGKVSMDELLRAAIARHSRKQ